MRESNEEFISKTEEYGVGTKGIKSKAIWELKCASPAKEEASSGSSISFAGNTT